MRKWVWGVLATLVVAAVVVPSMVARGAEGGDQGRRAPERTAQREPDRPAVPAEMEQRAQMLRRQIDALRRSAEAFQQQDMPDLAQQLRARAEQSQRELEGMMQAMQQGGGGMRERGRPGAEMPQIMPMVQHQQEVLDRLLEGQDRLRGQLGEINEKLSALQKQVGALREQVQR